MLGDGANLPTCGTQAGITDPIFGLALCTKLRNTCTKRVHKDKPPEKMGSVISVKLLGILTYY
jgi:hypothetical protein